VIDMPNSLANQTSPYLLQHADNPVDWMPWGFEALEKARREDKPIFLSIGYTACHWCHVMAHESFENPKTAAIMNEHFVNIKVDREERPDLDGIYMNAVVAMTGQGGWPMSVFLTPEGKPFYGGTYFPPVQRYGMPAFNDVLMAAAQAWRDDRTELRDTGQKLAANLNASIHWEIEPGKALRGNILEQAAQALLSAYSWQLGGWGRAPLFPQPMAVEFLLLQAARGNRQALEAARHNLRAMELGGMYDVVGGGFHRYSTDASWLVPHFEKMLYDNAQLSLAYLHTFLLTREASFHRTVVDTLDFILAELTGPEGGFYSSLDADSEGEEGVFYVWTLDEIRAVLAPTGTLDLFELVYSLSPDGNFEGRSVLRRRAADSELAEVLGMDVAAMNDRLAIAHRALFQTRSRRPRPQTDDKVLVSWNALALRAFAEAARYLDRPDYLQVARRSAEFLLRELHPADRLMRAWRSGQARHDAFLEDYAALILGLLALYQSDPDPRWYAAAEDLAAEMIAQYSDPQGGFFDTRRDAPALFSPAKDSQDNATPCGNSLAAWALLQLSAYNGRADWRALAEAPFPALQDGFARHPAAFGMWLQALDFLLGPVRQVALVAAPGSADLQALKAQLWQSYRPRLVSAVAQLPIPDRSPLLLADRPLLAGLATAYVCAGFTCRLPLTSPQDFELELNRE
jgi:uncharacterized protein